MSFLSKYRNIFFPSIKDWSSNHDYERNRKDWWKLTTPEFLLFCPVAYRWILFWMVGVSTLIFTALSIVTWINQSYFWTVVCTLLAGRLWWATYKKLKTWKVANTMNFYDLFFRDSIIK